MSPDHPDRNRHHTEGYRSYEDWASQFDREPDTGEPNVFDAAYLREANAHIIERMGEPIELDGWWDEIDEELANLTNKVAASATGVKQ